MLSSFAQDGSGQQDTLPSVQALISDAAERSPALPFIRHNHARISYSDVLPLLSRIASQTLLSEGMRVLILLPDSPAAALIHLACMVRAATMIPLSPFSASAHVRYVVDRVQPDIVFTTPILHSKFAEILDDAMGLVEVDNGDPGGWRFFKQRAKEAPARRSSVRAIFFTSGTTGEPKGVCLSESNLLSAAQINRSILQLDSSRSSLVMVPLYDYYGAIQLASHLMAGASCTVGASGQFPGSAIELILSHSITDLVLVPYTLGAMLDYVEKSSRAECRKAWDRIEYVASSSDLLSADILQRAFEINHSLAVVNVYGLTEAGRACYRVIRESSLEGNSIGRPSPGMSVRVDAPAGETGEIVIAGPTLMMGYLKAIVDHEISFTSVPELRTADDAYLGEDEEIHLLGRRDHLISIHGMKLHPAEIEIPVNQSLLVKDSMASLGEDDHGDKFVILDVVADRDSITKDQVLDLLRPRIPRPFLPQTINFVNAISRTEIGEKLVRQKARP